jgi:hypothetical protein
VVNPLRGQDGQAANRPNWTTHGCTSRLPRTVHSGCDKAMKQVIPRIKIALRPSTRDKSERLLATFAVEISTKQGPLRIDDCSVYRTKNGHTNAALPSFCEKLDGKLTYRSTVSLPAALETEVLRLAMIEYGEWQRARTPAPTERGKLFPTPAQRAATNSN